MRIYRLKKKFTVQFNRVTCLVCNWKHARTDRVKDHVKSVHRILTPTFQVHYRDSFEDGMYESMNFLRSWHRRNNDKRTDSLNSWPFAFTSHFCLCPVPWDRQFMSNLLWKFKDLSGLQLRLHFRKDYREMKSPFVRDTFHIQLLPFPFPNMQRQVLLKTYFVVDYQTNHSTGNW